MGNGRVTMVFGQKSNISDLRPYIDINDANGTEATGVSRVGVARA